MKKLLLSTLFSIIFVGCTNQPGQVSQKIDQLEDRINTLEQKSDQIQTKPQTDFSDMKDWKVYENVDLGLKFLYPDEIGEIPLDRGKDAYFLHRLRIDPDTGYFVNAMWIHIFTDDSVKAWEQQIAKDLESGNSVGDSGMPEFSLSIKDILKEASLGKDCKDYFHIKSSQNERCEIVQVNGYKAFKLFQNGPFQSEVSQIMYIFYQNGKWYQIHRNFWQYDEADPTKKLFNPEELNNILSGKKPHPAIEKQIKVFEKIVSTIGFIP